VVIMLSAIEATKTRRGATPGRAPVRSVALGFTDHHTYLVRADFQSCVNGALGHKGISGRFAMTGGWKTCSR
jgi:hypothetical protein